MSRAGYAIWGVALLLVAAILALAPTPPLMLGILLVGCVLAILAVGYFDTRAYRRAAKRGRPSTGV